MTKTIMTGDGSEIVRSAAARFGRLSGPVLLDYELEEIELRHTPEGVEFTSGNDGEEYGSLLFRYRLLETGRNHTGAQEYDPIIEYVGWLRPDGKDPQPLSGALERAAMAYLRMPRNWDRFLEDAYRAHTNLMAM
ncbi:MAG TPA: hypothetical protein VE986_05420 [Hyphomicrobiales bacterium]|nr:hypothetical protein [Hyphomicrobiales bacterium]